LVPFPLLVLFAKSRSFWQENKNKQARIVKEIKTLIGISLKFRQQNKKLLAFPQLALEDS
jgi:hypothetical protein